MVYLFLFLLQWPAYAQNHDPLPAGAASAALGFTSLTDRSAFAAFHNPAAMAFAEHTMAAAYLHRQFMVEGLDRGVVAAVMPTKAGSFGLSGSFFGFSAYNESNISLGYGRLLAEDFSIGVQFHWLHTGLAEYGQASAFTASAGILYQAGPRMQLGAYVFNVAQANMGSELMEPIPSVIRLGGSFTTSDKVTLLLEAVKDFRHPIEMRGGIEYKPIDWWHLRAGITTLPVMMTFGTGIVKGPVSIDFAYGFHQLLGSSPHFSLQYAFGE